MASEPKTLQEAIIYFADPVNCREYLVARRWPNGVACPRCGSQNVLFLEKYSRWQCRDTRERRITGTGGQDKTAVTGILERGGEVRVAVVPSRRKKALQDEVRKHVAAGTALYTDALQSYDGLAQEYAHKVIDHAEKYVD